MNWRTLILLVVALSLFSPFVDASICAPTSCCAEMESCRGHCECPPKQTCSVAKPTTVDQQTVARGAQVSPRVQIELFTLALDPISALESDRHSLAWLPESPPPKPAQPPQARLCLWLI
jgi:hypothetical protein